MVKFMKNMATKCIDKTDITIEKNKKGGDNFSLQMYE
jgi:hypothetical protein